MRESIHRSKQKETYQQAAKQEEKVSGIPNSSLEAVMAGKTRASSEMMGHRQDLAPSLAAKMSKAFGMDLSQMQVYRSGAMQDTGMQGMASGNKIVLSRDIDLNTTAGQAVLGHEISHVRAQSQGIGMGHSGLYQNAGLEHQADAEGMMAARGQSILGESTGMETGLGIGGIGGLAPLSNGMSASAGAPMQASGKGKKQKQDNCPYGKAEHTVQYETKGNGEGEKPLSPEDVINGVQWKASEKDETFKERKEREGVGNWNDFCLKGMKKNPERRDWMKGVFKQAGGELYKQTGVAMNERLIDELAMPIGDSTSDKDMKKLMKNMASKNKRKQRAAKLMIKEMHYQDLLRREKKYGKLLEQMSVEDLEARGGMEGFGADTQYGNQMNDVNQETQNYKGGVKFADKKKEKRYNDLNNYFLQFSNYMMIQGLMGRDSPEAKDFLNTFQEAQKDSEGNSVIQGGPSMSDEQLAEYKKKWKMK